MEDHNILSIYEKEQEEISKRLKEQEMTTRLKEEEETKRVQIKEQQETRRAELLVEALRLKIELRKLSKAEQPLATADVQPSVPSSGDDIADAIKDFVSRMCETSPKYISKSADLYDTFSANSDCIVTRKEFAVVLKKLGFLNNRGRPMYFCSDKRVARGFVGLRLKQ